VFLNAIKIATFFSWGKPLREISRDKMAYFPIMSSTLGATYILVVFFVYFGPVCSEKENKKSGNCFASQNCNIPSYTSMLHNNMNQYRF
jgi:hypothetical protein